MNNDILYLNINLKKNAKTEILTVSSLPNSVRLRGFPTGLKHPVKRKGCEFSACYPFPSNKPFYFKIIMLAGYV